jgi:RNA 3'-terminal phosphate cyclase (ATP)
VRALVSSLPAGIAERELAVVRASLDWPHSAYTAEIVESDGPGNIVMVTGVFSQVAEVATGFGQRGVPAETVAETALDCWKSYENSGAPVGEHLADQLLLPVALAGGGSFVTMTPTLHTLTNMKTIARFLPARFETSPAGRGQWLVSAG